MIRKIRKTSEMIERSLIRSMGNLNLHDVKLQLQLYDSEVETAVKRIALVIPRGIGVAAVTRAMTAVRIDGTTDPRAGGTDPPARVVVRRANRAGHDRNGTLLQCLPLALAARWDAVIASTCTRRTSQRATRTSTRNVSLEGVASSATTLNLIKIFLRSGRRTRR